MRYKFSKSSMDKLNTCHSALKMLALRVIEEADCKVVTGHRDEEEQNRVFSEGLSKKQWPDSKHNTFLSLAMDLAPYIAGQGVVWDRYQAYYFAGIVRAKANEITKRTGIKFRWGGDWDSDGDVNDQTFRDLVHWEVVT